MTVSPRIAIVAGIGVGLGNALCRHLAGVGYRVAGIARGATAHAALQHSLGPDSFLPLRGDVTDAAQVDVAVAEVEAQWGPATLYIHNAAAFHQQPFLDTDPSTFESLWRTMVLGAVQGVHRVLPGMLQAKQGALLFIGATASVKAGAQFSAFGAAKFALRGLAQSLAREFGPQGIHVAHLIIDGILWSERVRVGFGVRQDQCLDPDAVARTCVHLLEQDRSAWTQELDLRPAVEPF